MYENYQIRMGDGWTVNDESFSRQPMFKRRKIDAPYSHLINHTFRSTSGLNGLQLARNVPISLSAMDTACEHVWKCLHNDVRQHVLVPPPNGPCLWSENQQDRDAMYAKIALPEHLNKTSKEYRFFTNMKAQPWIVWPLWVEDTFGKDYITVLIYSEQTNPRAKPARFDQVVYYTIIDPRRAQYGTRKKGDPTTVPLKRNFLRPRTRRVEDALRDFLTRAGYNLDKVFLAKTIRNYVTKTSVALTEDKIESPMRITNCSPMPADEVTSAERCFATVKELLERIVKWHLTPASHKQPQKVFRHLRRWINPYQFRIEMTGINAWVLMATLDYNARITVELMPDDDIYVAMDGKRKRFVPYDLAGPTDQPPLAPVDWKLPGVAAPPQAAVAATS